MQNKASSHHKFVIFTLKMLRKLISWSSRKTKLPNYIFSGTRFSKPQPPFNMSKHVNMSSLLPFLTYENENDTKNNRLQMF